MSAKKDKPAGEGAHTKAALVSNPLRDGLRRCQALGEAALRDDGCVRLWAEQRDRFLGLNKPSWRSRGGPDNSRSPGTDMRASQ
jgi:conjugative transfer region protein TrbK